MVKYGLTSAGFRVIGKEHGGEKVSKKMMNYRDGDDSTEHACKYCTMFRKPNSCTFVSGNISPSAVCDAFIRK